MKRFSSIRVLAPIQEDADSIGFARSGPLGQENAVDSPDIAIWDVANNESINRINAYLSQASAKPTFDPGSVVRQIQRKLSIIGLQFILPSNTMKRGGNGAEQGFPANPNPATRTGEAWEENYPLSFLGGRRGVLDNNYTIGKDDNISYRRGGGLTLKIKYKIVDEDSGMYFVTPRIVPATPAGK